MIWDLVVRRWRDTREVKLDYLLHQIHSVGVLESELLFPARDDLKFVLKALEESGNITLDNGVLGDITPTPKALNTLAEYEETKARHEDALQLSKYQLWVAVAVGVVGPGVHGSWRLEKVC